MRYRLAIWLLRPLLQSEYWRCVGSQKFDAAGSELHKARRDGYWQGRYELARDLLAHKGVGWMSGPEA